MLPARHGTAAPGRPGPVRPAASDRSDPVDRQRGRRLASGIVTAALSRATGVLVPLVLIPATLSYLGADLYGLWMTVTALTGMVAFADLGLGNGLMTKLAPCHASGDVRRARRYVSSAYLLLTAVALGVCVLLWAFAGLVPWASLFNASGSVTPSDARAIALVCLTAFVINVPLSLVHRVQYAYQQVGRSNIWQAVGAVLALPLAVLAMRAELSPVAVVAATVIGPVLVNAANTVWTYGHRMRDIAPRLGPLDRELTGELLRLGGLFFVLTIVGSLAFNADTLIIAHTLGLESVTAYAVPARLFTQLGLLVTLVNAPLWSVNGDALARGQVDWVRRTAGRMTVISGLSALLPTAVLVAFGDRLFATWLGVPLGQDRWLLAGLAGWLVILALTSPRLMVQNAAGVVRPQLLGLTLYLVVSVAAKWYGSLRFGMVAVPYIGIAAYALTFIPAAWYGYRRALRSHPPRPAGPAPTDQHDREVAAMCTPRVRPSLWSGER